MTKATMRVLDLSYLGALLFVLVIAFLRGSSLNSTHPDGREVISTSSASDLYEAFQALTGGTRGETILLAVVRPDCDVCRMHTERIVEVARSVGGSEALILSIIPTNFPSESYLFGSEVEGIAIQERDLSGRFPMTVLFVPTFAALTEAGFRVIHGGIPDWRQRIRFRMRMAVDKLRRRLG